jgi:muramoyltetrapeptide carboxypeptidase
MTVAAGAAPTSAIAPPRVARGQTIGVVAPSGPVVPRQLDRLRRGLELLGDAFALRVADSVTAPRVPGTPSYLAADDRVRAAELSAMLADPDVRGIIIARGGYGAMRILPELDPSLMARDPKPIVGFSDATALLAWAHRAGVRGIHGPLIVQLGDLPPADVAHLITVLTDPRPLGERPWRLRSHGRGRVRGLLVPANLSLASLLVGTPWQLPRVGAIALFEEVGERPYEIDRYATQLALTGALSGTVGAVIGDLTRCVDPSPPTGDPDPDDAALAALVERLAAAGVPAADGAPIGHGRRNEAVPFGAACELDLDRGVLAIVEPAVA